MEKLEIKDSTSSSRTIFLERKPRWTIYADRIIAILGLVGSFVLVALLAYEWGAENQRITTPKCTQKILNQMDWYSPEELRRIASARARMERIR